MVLEKGYLRKCFIVVALMFQTHDPSQPITDKVVLAEITDAGEKKKKTY